MTAFPKNRRFVLWDYHPSLQQLLFRSPKTESDPQDENIDLLFRGTFYLQTGDWFRGLTIEQPTREEIERLFSITGVSPDDGHQYYILAAEGKRHVVGAARLIVTRNKHGFRESDITTFP